MNDNSSLSQIILNHWQEHCPRMVAELRANHHLEHAIAEAEERTADLLYELLSVRKLPYQDAWEMAMREWAYLPTEDPRSSFASLKLLVKNGPPATSG